MNVLQPLAFVVSGDILKAMTEGVIQFVIGEANGTGIPQFVVDVQESLRTVQTSHALAFLRDFDRYSNSPFSGSIGHALEKDFFSGTSLRGYWERNMDTLRQSSSLYSDAYLYGDWPRGGRRSWFALTTRYENNPYMKYEQSRKKLAEVVGPGVQGATGARLEELAWGDGFMSWCGDASEGLVSGFGQEYTLESGQESSLPGDPCIVNGKTKSIQTPGTVIANTLNRVLGYEGERVARMGNVGPQINKILNNAATIAQTVGFAKQILGGKDGSGGLARFSSVSSTRNVSPLKEYATTPGSLGITQADIYQDAVESNNTQTILTRAADYEQAWNVIKSSANHTNTTLEDLALTCPNFSQEAENVRTSVILPIIAKAEEELLVAEHTKEEIARVTNEVSQDSGTTVNYLEKVLSLQALPPSHDDFSAAVANSQASDGAVPGEGLLGVSGGTTIDQMELIRLKAIALKVSCAIH
jgi:hypothetical protein